MSILSLEVLLKGKVVLLDHGFVSPRRNFWEQINHFILVGLSVVLFALEEVIILKYIQHQILWNITVNVNS